jgi:hypothetical protein
MPLRKLAKVRPISDRAKLQFVENINNNAMAYVVGKPHKKVGVFLSSQQRHSSGSGQMVR